LPGNDDDLETSYSEQDMLDVADDDEVYVDQTASGGLYAIHQFKVYAGSQDTVTVYIDAQTDKSPVTNPVYLQIYNRNTNEWETIDTDDFSEVDTDFVLTAQILDLTDYKDENTVIACRVYQESVA